MNKIKTLKDLQKDKGNCDSLEIRQEAIKWVKYYEEVGKVSALEIMGKQKESFGVEGKQVFNNEVEMWMTAKIISFITFFNLTEEDLKGDKKE